jgi:AcrR family transcriptional regulator
MSPDILAAAAQLVETHGPSGFTMDDLARAAGLSRATLYRQVGSREAVLDALQAAGSPVGDRKEVRDRIFEGARAVFGRAGFDGATIEAIAAEAGVGVATIYRHFRDSRPCAGPPGK